MVVKLGDLDSQLHIAVEALHSNKIVKLADDEMDMELPEYANLLFAQVKEIAKKQDDRGNSWKALTTEQLEEMIGQEIDELINVTTDTHRMHKLANICNYAAFYYTKLLSKPENSSKIGAGDKDK